MNRIVRWLAMSQAVRWWVGGLLTIAAAVMVAWILGAFVLPLFMTSDANRWTLAGVFAAVAAAAVASWAQWWAKQAARPAPDRNGNALGERPEQPYRATVREIRRRTPQLVGRERELAELADFATGTEAYRWLVGGAWAGKTALAAEVCTAAWPPSVDVVAYFLSRRGGDADGDNFLSTVVPQLAYLLEEDPPVAGLDVFWALWAKATGRAAETSRHLLLVVDGLDEDMRPEGVPSVASQLPGVVGANAHVLVTSRPYPDLPSDVPVGHPLRTTPSVELAPFPGAQRLAELAELELENLLDGDNQGLAVEVLGVLTAAAGPLAIDDLATLASDLAPTTPNWSHQINRLVTRKAARTLQPVGSADDFRYQFAHSSLLEQAQTDQRLGLRNAAYRRRIERWAERWRAAGWPLPSGHEQSTPRYLLDTYPSTLTREPRRLVQLAGDIGWIGAAIAASGVNRVLADLRRAAAADPTSTRVAAILAAVVGQAHNMRPSQPLDQPGYVLRQLWMQAAEPAEDDLADDIRSRLQSRPGSGPVPQWTTRRASRALSGELGRHQGWVQAVAALADGRVVTGGGDGRVLMWDPADPGAGPAELGRHHSSVETVAVLADGRVVTGGGDGRVLMWDPADPGAGPAELGRHDGPVETVAVLADGRVVTGGADGKVLMWDPADPGADSAELGRHDGPVEVVAVLADGRVVTAGRDRRVLMWDPADPGADPAELGRHDSLVEAVAVLADGRVVTGGADGRVLAWDPADPKAGPARLGRYDGWVQAVAVLADGRVVTGGADGRVLMWDPADPGADPAELGRHDGWVNSVAVLANGRVVTGGADGRVLMWDPADPGPGLAELGRYEGWVKAVAVLASGWVVTGGADGKVLMWDPADPDPDPTELGRHHSSVEAVAVLASGRVVTAGGDRRVLMWDPADPSAGPTELGRHDNWDRAVAVLANGRVVTGGDDGKVLMWDPAQPGADPTELGRHDDRVNSVAVLANGRVVTGGDDGKVLVWDPSGASAEAIQLSCFVTALAAAPLSAATSSLVIAHAGSGISLWSFTR